MKELLSVWSAEDGTSVVISGSNYRHMSIRKIEEAVDSPGAVEVMTEYVIHPVSPACIQEVRIMVKNIVIAITPEEGIK